jgi:hypothetical protein
MLFLNIITIEIEALVSGNKFLYVCVKEVCCLLAKLCFNTFHQLIISAEMLLLQVGKQVVVAQSEIRAARRMIKQLTVEMLQQCLSVSSCMQMCIVMDQHYTICQHSISFILNDPMQFL